MVQLLAAAGVFAGGVWLIVAALWPPRPPLTVALQRLHTAGSPRPLQVPSTVPDRSIIVSAGRWLIGRARVAAVADDATLTDLELLRRPVEVHAGTCALGALVGAAAGPAMWFIVAAAGTPLPVLIPVWLSVIGAAAGFVTPRLIVRTEAARARRDFRHALSAYLDLLVLLLAAGEGPEGAMETAARAGNGSAFMALRRATVQARLSGEPIWDTLDDLGRRIDIVELREIAAAGSLAGERGAAVRRSLVAKASGLRTTSLAAAEAEARRRSQALFAPVTVMGFGFILFLLYPLVTNIQIG